jgi:hypothetical protein
LARSVSIEAPSPLTLTLAFNRSNSSRNCSRVCFVVPRMSMEDARLQAALRPILLCSSPQRRFSRACTVPPRVFFGNSASFMPPGNVRSVVRASMLDGVGSNTSPAATAVEPL